MTSVWYLLRLDARRRIGSLLLVTALIGVVGAIVLTALAGARRTDSAYPRLLDALRSAHASVEVGPEYFDAIEAMPEVEEVAPASYMFLVPTALPESDVVTLAAVDERFLASINRPLLVEGDYPDYDRVDEVFVNTVTAEALDVGAGDSIRMQSLTPEQMQALIDIGDPGEPAGPTVEVTVAGVGRTELEATDLTPLIIFTPAFYAAHHDDIGHFDDILDVRLVDGLDGTDAFQSALDEIVPASEGAVVESQTVTVEEIRDATRTPAISLAVFALAAALAGFVAISQAIAQVTSLSSSNQPGLIVLGLAQAQRFLALALPSCVAAVLGATIACGLSVVASPLMPIGVADEIEPDAGYAVDWTVLVLGFVAITALVSARTALTAWRTSSGRGDVRSRRAPRLTGRLARAGISPPVVTGVQAALEPGRGRSSVPVRSALIGAVAGIAGLVAALAFGAALDEALTEPAAYGSTWDATVLAETDGAALIEQQVSDLATHPDIAGVATLGAIPIRIEGVPAQSYGIEVDEGGGFLTILDGRAPEGGDEIVVGSETLDRLDREVGDTVTAEGLEGSAPREVVIVGVGVFPEIVHPAVPDSDTGAYNDFAMLTLEGIEAFTSDAGGEGFVLLLVRAAPGVDAGDLASRLEDAEVETIDIDRPARFVNLAQVDRFPSIVAAFLLLTAAFAIAFAVDASVRRRARDRAVLETMGFVSAQVRISVIWQALTPTVVGLVFGIPLGLVVGRTAWAYSASRLGIEVQRPVPWLAIAVIVVAALPLAASLALYPARRAVRSLPADALRAE